MNIIDIIEKKKKSDELSYEELQYVVMGYVEGKIPDYQMSALLMAITLKGMSKIEIFNLTDIMIQSGETLDLSGIEGYKVDKHSTGGVGDKTTLAVLPIVASCGVKCAKMSGKGLGFTGGTIDKLESIPGFQTNLEFDQFIDQVNSIGLALMSQTGNLCPADKKIYALRDVTGTTDSIPLIASSIMSKKIASGADKIVIDLKVGRGAFMKTLESARRLARTMIEIGQRYDRDVICLVTNMSQPLGSMVGNQLEVEEAYQLLKNEPVRRDFKEVVMTIATYMVHLGKNISLRDAKKEVETVLKEGKALEKFHQFIEAQHGKLEFDDLPGREIVAPKSGYVTRVEPAKIGELVKELGGGREKTTDQIDYRVGIKLHKKVGEKVKEGEVLLTVYENQKKLEDREYLDCFTIEKHSCIGERLIYGTVGEMI